MIAQIKMRRGTTAEWAAASPVVLAEGEPGWDTTLKGIKVGDGATEWAGLPWIDAKNRPNINADTLDGVHLSDIRLGQNLLHNWDFRNPINQRGVSGAISTGSYFYDRWVRNTGTVTLSPYEITLSAGGAIVQRIEGIGLAGKTVTLSVLSGNNIHIGSGTFGVVHNESHDFDVSGFGSCSLGHGGSYLSIKLTSIGLFNVSAIKLELGTVSTLHLDPPMDYGVELLKCQRFFVRLKPLSAYGLYAVGVAAISSQAVYPVSLPCPMRVLPSMTISGALNRSNLSASTMSGSILHLVQSGTFTEGSALHLMNNGDSNAYIDLSSDL